MDEYYDEPGFRRGAAGEPRFVGPSWRQGYVEQMWEAAEPYPPNAWRWAPAMDDAWRQGEPPVPVDYRGVGPKGYRRSDERLHEEICERICIDPRVDASGFEVEVADAVVTLRGAAPDRQTKRLSGAIAASITGVADVMNELRIERPEPGDGASATRGG